MRYSRLDPALFSRDSRAAIFVDYENLYNVIGSRVKQGTYPDEFISEMLDELRRYLAEEDRTQPSVSVAFADFSALSGNGFFIQRSLYLQGTEPRFVPESLQTGAVEQQLTAEAVATVHTRRDVQTVVILTGNRPYFPLAQQIKKSGRNVVIAALEAAPTSEAIHFAETEVFLDAHNLLSEASRRELIEAAPAGTVSIAGRNGATVEREPVEYHDVTDPVQLQTLEIIESFFGQYEEVYLTPLLRKLSEIFDDRDHDPKTIISTLEELGAVRLEKRRGFPYDYTVLIVESEHPDVKRVQEEVLTREDEPVDFNDDYDDHDYYGDDYDSDDDYADDVVDEADFEDDVLTADAVDEEESASNLPR